MGCDKDVFDIFGFGWGKLFRVVNKGISAQFDEPLALIFVPPLTDFSKDVDMANGRCGDVKSWLGYLQQDCLS